MERVKKASKYLIDDKRPLQQCQKFKRDEYLMELKMKGIINKRFKTDEGQKLIKALENIHENSEQVSSETLQIVKDTQKFVSEILISGIKIETHEKQVARYLCTTLEHQFFHLRKNYPTHYFFICLLKKNVKSIEIHPLFQGEFDEQLHAIENVSPYIENSPEKLQSEIIFFPSLHEKNKARSWEENMIKSINDESNSSHLKNNLLRLKIKTQGPACVIPEDHRIFRVNLER